MYVTVYKIYGPSVAAYSLAYSNLQYITPFPCCISTMPKQFKKKLAPYNYQTNAQLIALAVPLLILDHTLHYESMPTLVM